MTAPTADPIDVVLARLDGVRQAGEGKWQARCPAHDDHNPSLSVAGTAEGTVLIRCWAGCPAEAVVAAMGLAMRDLFRCRQRSWLDSSPEPAPVQQFGHHDPQQSRRDRRKAAALAVWRNARPLTPDCPAGRYLLGRRLPSPWPPDLRHSPRCRHPGGVHRPALLGAVRARHGGVVAISRTYLTNTGRKTQLDPQRASLGATKGGAVRLGPVMPSISVTEGVEDALAVMVMRPGIIAWACLGASGLVSVELPRVVRDVLILADRDDAGCRAAAKLEMRLRSEGRTVQVAWPRHKDPAADLEALALANGEREAQGTGLEENGC